MEYLFSLGWQIFFYKALENKEESSYICLALGIRYHGLTHGVIGNTAGFGPVVLGSSPSGST